MKIAHLSDIHYCDPYLKEVDRCAGFALDQVAFRSKGERVDLIVLSGDLFDRRLEQNSPAMLAALKWVAQLADVAPVLILQGTFSHDAPRSLDVFRYVDGEFPIYVADRIEQVVYHGGTMTFTPSEDWRFEKIDAGAMVLFSCLPSVNKAAVAAAVGAEKAAESVGDYVAEVLKGWAPIHEQARAFGIPTVVVSHGTVNGCITEHGVPMAGLDHEYTTGSLFAAKADVVMLGHIHKHQAWGNDTQLIAYPGSLARLHFGEVDPKGFILWEVRPGEIGKFDLVETPAKRLIEIDYPGSPDMEDLAAKAAGAEWAHVRIRYAIDEEHRHSVDKEAIAAMFAAAEEVKIEARINPVQRQRSAGIVQAVSTGERLQKWCEYTESEAGPLLKRLGDLEDWEVERIVTDIVQPATEVRIPARDTELAELDDAMERGDPSAFRQTLATAESMDDF